MIGLPEVTYFGHLHYSEHPTSYVKVLADKDRGAVYQHTRAWKFDVRCSGCVRTETVATARFQRDNALKYRTSFRNTLSNSPSRTSKPFKPAHARFCLS